MSRNSGKSCVLLKDRRKKTRLVHINLLKEYKSRDVAVTELTAESQCLVVTSSPDVEESDITRCSHLVEPNDHEEERANAVVEPVLHNSQVLKNPGENLTHLQEEQAASIVHLLQEHVALFSDSPSLCPLLRHDVDVQDSHPVRQPPYRLNAEKREFLRNEVQRLLKEGLIELSLSPWTSPVVLVPKTDGSMRMYATIEKEALALLMSLEHFKVYVGQSPVTVYTDHNPLVFLERMKLNNQRLLRWSITLQLYNLVIRHIKGTDNLIADALSRA
ncbi:hypothetical protein Pmani_014584 [Petrolisthes manimaculis]|uniref:Reverse transcriptase RNase H-like domain-containing protein n=2 Tax=Petrolisthes manimaculis TaxID=1843537 RepID=A0AAE1PV55_9EUCA|nr:hypothetical protein Pmani_014584 [Petrolisthes manimaculis]